MKALLAILFLSLFLLFEGCANSTDTTRPESSIGVAGMSADGTITLYLRADENIGGKASMGEGVLVYTKNNPDYKKILEHLGGLKPGESKAVKPWPDKENNP